MPYKTIASFLQKHKNNPQALNGLANLLDGSDQEWVIELAVKQYTREVSDAEDFARINTPSSVLAHLDPIDEPVFLPPEIPATEP